MESTAEVLDLSHDCTTPFRLQFDDPSWQQYVDSLKPLGLAILLNTCNPSTQEKYAQFCAHLSCLGLFHEDLIPVTNRREWNQDEISSPCDNARTTIVNNLTAQTHGCLCELAKQIGFQSGARNVFSMKDQLFTFRHQADLARKDRLARSLSLPKLKFPFPNMVGVCVQESNSGSYQLLSQGTGEILLDACVDYWNGSDLCPLSVADRKRILDFYNRSSLTAYCTAFAYRPLSRRVQNINFSGVENVFDSSGVYLELPADSAHLYQPQHSPTPNWDTGNGSIHCQSRIQSDSNLYCHTPGEFHSRSNDSLLGNSPEENPQLPEGVFHVQCNQTFVAMVTMQYQARADMVQLIEQMDKACIRFVHFSKENELRSRVFSEKMGLESGWNCHVSLLSEQAESKEDGEHRRHKSVISLVGKDKEDWLAFTKNAFLSLEHSRPLSVSAPSAINVEVAQVKFEDEISLHNLTNDDSDTDASKDGERDRLFHSPKSPVSGVSVKTPSPHPNHLNCSSSLDHCSSSSSLINVPEGGGSSCWDVNLSRSQSHVTESTEQSAPVTFDLTNRAKLPRGVKEIRPHIENVDNVPLLVSLFTDCTPSATREMIEIMQEYGEVVCIVGSSASSHNSAIFMQADASLGVEPLYPQVCQQVPVCEPVTETNILSPTELSRRLNSVPCALSFHRDELPSLLHLVLESRHLGLCLRNALQLWAASVASLSFIQLAAAIFFLPPIFTIGQVLWLTCITIPILAISLIGAPTNPSVMSIATGKNVRNIDRETLNFVGWCYGLKFLPSIIILLSVYATTLMAFCTEVTLDCKPVSTCNWVYPSQNGTVLNEYWSGWTSASHQHFLYKIQHTIAFAFVFYLVFISLSFIHRQHHFWEVNPMSNRLWIVCCFIVIGLQAIYFSSSVYLFQDNSTKQSVQCHSNLISAADVHLPAWLAFLWPMPLIGLNELVKHYEIKMNVRHQKRERLDFGTKLGMNSPF